MSKSLELLKTMMTWRTVGSQLRILVSSTNRFTVHAAHFSDTSRSFVTSLPLAHLFNRYLSMDSVKKKVEDIMPIATGHELEELEAEIEGRDLLEINHPVGPFGTKEAPAVVKSNYDWRIIGCPGGEGEDEHDVVWFWLKKGEPFECPVCSQYFVLEVLGPGGPPDGHEDEDDH